MRTQASRQSAKNAMYRNCTNDPIDASGTWRQQVDAHTGKSCPLRPCRLRTKPKSAYSETAVGSGYDDK